MCSRIVTTRPEPLVLALHIKGYLPKLNDVRGIREARPDVWRLTLADWARMVDEETDPPVHSARHLMRDATAHSMPRLRRIA